jgi:hypothetical protein
MPHEPTGHPGPVSTRISPVFSDRLRELIIGP